MSTREDTERLKHLRAAYDAYMAAELGSLNLTAKILRDEAEATGWHPAMPIGVKPWTEKVLAPAAMAQAAA